MFQEWLKLAPGDKAGWMSVGFSILSFIWGMVTKVFEHFKKDASKASVVETVETVSVTTTNTKTTTKTHTKRTTP